MERLSVSSRRTFQNPYQALDWPEQLGRPGWFTSPELVSLFGSGRWEALDPTMQMELSFYEAVNFYSLNIHGEKALMQGLAGRLYDPRHERYSTYLHHFLDEENKHSIYFGTFCDRYAGGIYADRKLAFDRTYQPGEEDFLFFAKVLIFEEIVDRYNVLMGKDDRLHPVARFINTNHHSEEVRHLIFGRALVADLWDAHAPQWPATTVSSVRAYLGSYLAATWREYYNPDAYRDAGFDDPWAVADEAWASDLSHEHRLAFSKKIVEFFLSAGIMEEVPVP